MILSKRLQTIAEQVDKDSIVADIGTDHGYIPINLAKEGIIKHAFAMDINQGPLARAKKNIKRYGVESIVETRLSNGVMSLKPGEADTLIFAGMGGKLISELLMNGQKVIKKARKLILSPHIDVDVLRKAIHHIDFKIEMEAMICEEEKYYTIITAVKGQQTYTNERDYQYGKILIDQKSKILKAYILKKYNTHQKIIKELEGISSENSKQRQEILKQKNREMEEVLKCL